MSQAKEDIRNAPIRRYLLQALVKQGLSGTQWDCLAVIMDETYGWMKPGQTNRSVRKDRESFDYQEMADRLGVSFKSISRSMGELIKRKIVTQFSPPTKTKPGVYGVQSETSKWLSKDDIRGQKCPPKTNMSRQKCPPIGTKVSTNRTKVSTNNRANPHEIRAKTTLNQDLNQDLNQLHVEGAVSSPVLGTIDELSLDEIGEVISNPNSLLKYKHRISETQALQIAEGAYLRSFARSLSSKNRVSMEGFCRSRKTPFGFLAAFLIAVTATKQHRDRERANGLAKEFKTPFAQIEFKEFAAAVNRLKSKRERSTGPPSSKNWNSDDDEEKELAS